MVKFALVSQVISQVTLDTYVPHLMRILMPVKIINPYQLSPMPLRTMATIPKGIIQSNLHPHPLSPPPAPFLKNGVLNRVSTMHSPQKRATWEACKNYLHRPIIFFFQMNNLNVAERLEFQGKLKECGLALKTPKASILKKAMRMEAGLGPLEPAIVGFSGLAIGQWSREALQTVLMQNTNKVILIGGKICNNIFTPEGLRDAMQELKGGKESAQELVALLQSAPIQLSSILESAPRSLASVMEQRLKVDSE